MAARVKINKRAVDKAIASYAPTNKLLQREAKVLASSAAEEVKSALKYEFIAHPITQEILKGPHANSSLLNLGGWGSLFAFLGFDEFDDPIGPLLDIIDRQTSYEVYKIRNGVYGYRVFVPSVDDFQPVAELSWLGGSNWVKQIPNGIPGLANFLPSDGGRSGGGIQTKGRVRSEKEGKSVRGGYYAGMVKNAERNFRKAVENRAFTI